MRLKKLMIALIATIALFAMMGCGSSRQVTTTDVRSKMSEVRCDTVKEQVVVAVHDTIMETTTINVQTSEAGDTVRLVQITERDRIRAMSDVRSKRENVRIERDTVYVAVRDSIAESRNYGVTEARNRASPVVSGLRWVFWIIVCLIVLVLILKFGRI